ncbi:MAG: LolA family protein [Bacteroidota bacterium]
MKKISSLILLFVAVFQVTVFGQVNNVLMKNVQAKLDKVTDYEAEGKMKTNVAFLKLPIAKVKMYFKNPNKFKLKSENGMSFVPKGSMSINLNSLFLNNNFTIIEAGAEKIANTNVKVLKLLPNDDAGDLVLTTLYIDPINFLILKSRTTTRENGTYELQMTYGNFSKYGLPDKIIFSFNTKDYKLPKGITFDFDDGSAKNTASKSNVPKKGEIEIVIAKYQINKGISNDVFK